MTKTGRRNRLAEELREFALALPDAHEAFPWGERVVKVGKKVFVFLGRDDEEKKKMMKNASPAKKKHMGEPGEWGMSVKLTGSRAQVLARPFARPTDYGLGAKGWVSLAFAPGEAAPLDELKQWIRESYCAIAPKKLVKQLDGDA